MGSFAAGVLFARNGLRNHRSQRYFRCKRHPQICTDPGRRCDAEGTCTGSRALVLWSGGSLGGRSSGVDCAAVRAAVRAARISLAVA